MNKSNPIFATSGDNSSKATFRSIYKKPQLAPVDYTWQATSISKLNCQLEDEIKQCKLRDKF